MLILTGFVLGALLGYRAAHRRGGNTLDKAQYAGVWGIGGAILGLFATLALGHAGIGGL
ncbi:MAG: hypothetical protein JJU40_05495 [Rhodobacteraceae bacterium]|nr:hypothetical protein [Paracoccaceae bacterium]